MTKTSILNMNQTYNSFSMILKYHCSMELFMWNQTKANVRYIYLILASLQATHIISVFIQLVQLHIQHKAKTRQILGYCWLKQNVLPLSLFGLVLWWWSSWRKARDDWDDYIKEVRSNVIARSAGKERQTESTKPGGKGQTLSWPINCLDGFVH